jgi:hypothetical protein
MNFLQPNIPNSNPFEIVKSKPFAFQEDKDLVTKQASDEKSRIVSE